MNTCMFTGRIVRDIETKYTTGENAMAIARFSLAVPRKFKREGDPDADFLNFVAFGKNAENIQKYFRKGKPIVIERSHVQTGSYTNKEGAKVYTTDFIVDEWNFVDKDNDNATEGNSGRSSGNRPTSNNRQRNTSSFMNIPDNVGDDETLPF